jgi:hypothetical protein
VPAKQHAVSIKFDQDLAASRRGAARRGGAEK